VPAWPIYRLSLGQYHDMVNAGILTEDDLVEFLDGWLVSKMPQKPAHRFTTRKIAKLLEALLGPGWYLESQTPITTDGSEPEPDVAVVRGQPELYRDRHPRADEVGLLVEVADATLSRDQTLKKRIYAAAGVAVYWIVNLPDRKVEVYSRPTGQGEQADYQHQEAFGPETLVPVVLDGREVGRVAAADILGPAPGTTGP
jgi:Uma2 family endonuclease